MFANIELSNRFLLIFFKNPIGLLHLNSLFFEARRRGAAFSVLVLKNENFMIAPLNNPTFTLFFTTNQSTDHKLVVNLQWTKQP